MKYLVSFSGVRTSAYMCFLAKQKHLDATFVFADTGAESDETYSFIKKCNSYFDLNLVCLRPKIDPELGRGTNYEIVPVESLKWDLEVFTNLVNKYSTPNYVAPQCTTELKRVTISKYQKATNPKAIQLIGIRADEPKRLKVKQGFAYLADISNFHKADINEFWANMPFNLIQPTYMGNCIFCIHKSSSRLALVARYLQSIGQEHKIEQWYNMTVNARNKGKLPENLYRNQHNLISAINIFEDYTTEEIKQKLRPEKGCEISCEAVPF